MSAGWINLGLGNYNAKCYDMDGSFAANVRPFSVVVDRSTFNTYMNSVGQIFALKGYDFIFNHYDHTRGLATSYSFKDDENVEVGRIDIPLLKEYYVTFAFRKDKNTYYYSGYAISEIQYPDPVAMINDQGGQYEDVSYLKCRILGTSYTPSTAAQHFKDGRINLDVDMIRNGVTKTLSVAPCMYLIDEYYFRSDDEVFMLTDYSYQYTGFEYWAFGFNPLVKYTSSNTIRLIIAPGMSLYHTGYPNYQICFGQIERPGTTDLTKYIDITNVTNIDPFIPTEVGYMDELDNRFSPRFQSNMIGIYPIPVYGTSSPEVSGIMDVAKSLMQTDIMDSISNMFASGNECVIGVKWFYGIKDKVQNKQSTDLCNICIGGKQLNQTQNIGAGGLPATIYAHAYPMMSEFVKWNTSKLSVPAYFENYLDFLSSYKLYLPYYGFIDIDPNDIVGGTIQVFYNINIVTGAAVITIACNNGRNGNIETKYYSVSTTVGMEIPFGTDMVKSMGLQMSEIISKSAKFAITTGATMMAERGANMISEGNRIASSVSDSNITDNVANLRADRAENMISQGTSLNATSNRLNRIAQNMPSNTPVASPNRSNGINNELGSLDELHPYLLITRPVSVAPADYEEYLSVPSCEGAQLSNIHGFTQIAAVKPENLTNAPKYLNEIISLLQAGVYL